MPSKIGYDHWYLRWNPRNGRHLVWRHGAPFRIFRDSHFVATIFLIIHAKFGDSSFNRLGAMALGVKKIRAGLAGSGRWRPRSTFWFTPLDSANFFQARSEIQIGLAHFV